MTDAEILAVEYNIALQTCADPALLNRMRESMIRACEGESKVEMPPVLAVAAE